MSHFPKLQEAVLSENKDKILEILKKNAVDLNYATDDYDGDTLLHLAFRNEKSSQEQLINILEMFLDRGADINAKNKLGRTILHLAVERRMRDVVDCCLRRNADMNVKDEKGNSIVQFLIEEECRKFPLDSTDNLEAFENESSSFVDWMVSRGFDFFCQENIRDSPLYMAANLNLQHILLILLNRISELPVAESHETSLLIAFWLSYNGAHPSANRRNGAPKAIPSAYYKSYYVHDILKIIVEKSKVMDDETLDMSLYLAVINSMELKIIELLVNRVKNVNFRNFLGDTIIETFVNCDSTYSEEDELVIIRNLILKGAHMKSLDRRRQTLPQKLFRIYPTFEMLRILKEGGADFSECYNYPDENFLNLISQFGDEAGMVRFIMNEAEFDVNETNSIGETPLLLAIKYKKEFAAVELIELGAKINVVNRNGASPLLIACKMGQIQVVEKLIEHGANINYRDKDGKTLLHLALGHLAVTELLLKNGVYVNAKDDSGKTPLHYARHEEIVKILVNRGAIVDATDNNGSTPLYDAIFLNKTSSIDELIKHGANMWNPKVFKLAVNLFNDPCQLKCHYSQGHLIKMMALGLLDKIPCALKAIGAETQNFLEQCQAEVELLKTYFLNDDMSLYDLLRRNQKCRCAYVDDENLKHFLKNGINKNKFPNYFVMIQGGYNEAAARKSLLDPAIDIFTSKIIKTNVPDLCIDMIFMHLNNMDLLNFLEACKTVHQCDSTGLLSTNMIIN